MRASLMISASLLLCLTPDQTPAQPIEEKNPTDTRWYIPDHIPLQFAGNIGFLSTGAGYHLFGGKYQVNVMYGYVPAPVAKKEIHLLTLKNMFPFYDLDLKRNSLCFYAGLAPTLEVGGNSFISLPANMPDGYYNSNALHLTVFLGGKFRVYTPESKSLVKGVEFFAEATCADRLLFYKVTQREVAFDQIFSLALGINILLTHSVDAGR